MFELEDFSSGYGYLNKYADSCNPSLDFYISDSLQDMLDIDIRSEIATVVGGSNELSSLVGEMPASFDYAIDAISSINSSSGINTLAGNNLHVSNSGLTASSSWFGTNGVSSWSASANSDFYADVGACVNPISVMPMISSSLMYTSPKTNFNANGLRSATSPPLNSPNGVEAKSHLTFSPAQMKVSAGAIRNEQLRIPKQIVSISSTVTAATTAPATMATNSVLQRKTNASIEAIKKDLGAELRKSSADSKNGSISHKNANGLMNGNTTNTIKLAPGIGGLTFANSITYNKLKQHNSKSPHGSPITTANGSIVIKRERGSSPQLHNMTTLSVNGSGQHITKILARNVGQTSANYTPKSIASAHSPLLQNGNNVNSSTSSSNAGATSSTNSLSSSANNNFSAGLATISNNNYFSTISSTSPLSTNTIPSIAVKALHQKIKPAPVESEYPKPAYSYSCLIAMALKNSRSGSLPVSEIYSFMCEHFPYFKTAPSGWKNSVRHNLSLNKCFEKIEKPVSNNNQRKGCLWAMNPDRIIKMDEEVQKWSRKDPSAIRCAMVFPEHLEALERGEMKHGSSSDSDVELDSQSEIEETSDLEEQEMDETVVDNMYVEEDIEDEDDDEMCDSIVEFSTSADCNKRNEHLTTNGSRNVINETDVDVEEDDSNIVLSQQHRDFDIEVEDFYDAIDLEDLDDKEAVRMAISQSDIIELSPSEMNSPQQVNVGNNNCGYQSPKRARLNVNYSIGVTGGEVDKQILKQQQQQRQQQMHNTKLVKVQQIQQLQQQLNLKQKYQQQQQHIVVQTITNGTTKTIQTPASQFTQITAIPSHNRRKMQLVSRIA